MPKALKITLGIILALVTIFIVVLSVAFLVINKAKTAGYVEFGEDKVPTIYYVLGEKKLNNISTEVENGIASKSYTYSATELSTLELNNYIEELSNQGYLITLNNNDNHVQMATESIDSGNIIIVDITQKTSEVIIVYSKGAGTLTIY